MGELFMGHKSKLQPLNKETNTWARLDLLEKEAPFN